MPKVADLVVVTGEYKNKEGEVKKKYLNVGAILENGNGEYIVLNPWFSPAGHSIVNDGKCFVSIYRDKSRTATSEPGASRPAFDDDVPF